jgi:hypothetical protein
VPNAVSDGTLLGMLAHLRASSMQVFSYQIIGIIILIIIIIITIMILILSTSLSSPSSTSTLPRSHRKA